MKYILITGANKGVGFETAKQLAQLGNYVFLGSRDPRAGQTAVERLKAIGIANVELLTLDVTDFGSTGAASAALEAKVGFLDVLINNAGISGDEHQRLADSGMESIRRVFETNFFGSIQVTQAMLPLLRKSTAASIINVSSEISSLAINTSENRPPNWKLYSTYGNSKTALNGFMVMLANELREENIMVNNVTPGYTATDLNQFKGLKTPEQGAKPIVELAMLTDRTVTGRFFKDGGEVPW
jgi:NAD(P)-dependent dehydrogenase (short-subunit alcohol dehydrogenase family)